MTARKVAIAHDWLTIPGGSEQVVLALLDLYPEADIYTTVYDPAPFPPKLTDRKVTASFLNRIPRATTIYPKLLPLMNAAFESFDLRGYDLVLSSSHANAKNVITHPGTAHVCYCHTPMRYAWDPGFLEGEAIGRATRLALPPLLGRLRAQDYAGAARPDVFVANSETVKGRIDKFYRRDATVVHPPVDVERFLQVPREPAEYYLVLGRVVPYKRVDLAVAACARLGRRVIVAGDGRALDAAREAAGPQAEFRGRVSDDELVELLRGAKALLFPGEEDFGIVPVEAQAAGVPVIAYGVGGAEETVKDGETGVLFPEQNVVSLAEAIERFEALDLDPAVAREHAAGFGHERFGAEMTSVIDECLSNVEVVK